MFYERNMSCTCLKKENFERKIAGNRLISFEHLITVSNYIWSIYFLWEILCRPVYLLSISKFLFFILKFWIYPMMLFLHIKRKKQKRKRKRKPSISSGHPIYPKPQPPQFLPLPNHSQWNPQRSRPSLPLSWPFPSHAMTLLSRQSL